jgi:uncharacterized protein
MNKTFQYLSFLGVGVLFGIALTKGEIVSWYRIQEMFRFQSFHMYGVIGTAVVLGIISNQVIKREGIKSITGQPITFNPKAMSIPRYLIGGSIFGLGWAMAGVCPGPMYILVGNGFTVMLVVIASAALGTLTYGALRTKLPH